MQTTNQPLPANDAAPSQKETIITQFLQTPRAIQVLENLPENSYKSEGVYNLKLFVSKNWLLEHYDPEADDEHSDLHYLLREALNEYELSFMLCNLDDSLLRPDDDTFAMMRRPDDDEEPYYN
jgi:hypothetical protein